MAIRAARKKLVTIEQARQQAQIDWDDYLPPVVPNVPGIHRYSTIIRWMTSYRISIGRRFRNVGTGGQISAHSRRSHSGRGGAALYADAQTMLARIVSEKWLTAKADDRIVPCL